VIKNTLLGFPHEPIKVTMPDGAEKEGVSFETSPFDIAAKISKQFAEKIVVAKVKYTKRVATLDEGLLNPEAEEGKSEEDQWYFWDVNRVLEGDCQLVLYKFDDAEGKETFWHSSAHVLGETLENEYGVHLCHGPPTDSGFFYDTYSGKDIFTEKNYKDIEKAAQKIVSEKQTFTRLVLTDVET
jgi:threonyl-tRNA synthetase